MKLGDLEQLCDHHDCSLRLEIDHDTKQMLIRIQDSGAMGTTTAAGRDLLGDIRATLEGWGVQFSRHREAWPPDDQVLAKGILEQAARRSIVFEICAAPGFTLQDVAAYQHGGKVNR